MFATCFTHDVLEKVLDTFPFFSRRQPVEAWRSSNDRKDKLLSDPLFLEVVHIRMRSCMIAPPSFHT